jgi:formylglycine-generating enzyme required for sulfatase activity
VVRRSDGTPWFVVDARPVSDAAFRHVFAKHRQPAAPGGAVVMVSYNDARAYANTTGGKLLTPDEWDAALSTPGVQPAGDLLEWIESPEVGDEKTRVARQRGQSLPRPDQGQPDVTFRMAKPPPGN